jgi:uncharacterized membrane protein
LEKSDNVGRSFRRRLKEELAQWEAEGLVSPEQAAALDERYNLSGLSGEGTSLLVATVYVVGAVLIAGGVITFVAAHWGSIPRAVRVALIFAAMLAAHAGGYTLWRIRGTRPRLGHALVVLGTLIFGANIGLMKQIFHISGDFYSVFAAWAAGAAVMAYFVGSVPNAVIALAASFVWYCGWAWDHSGCFSWYPALVVAAGLPIAYVKRSRVLFFLVLAAFGVSAHIAVGMAYESVQLVALTGVAIAFCLSSYGAFHATARPRREAALSAFALGGLSLALWSYALSFADMADEVADDVLRDALGEASLAGVFIFLIFCAGAVFALLSLRRVLGSRELRTYMAAIWISCALTGAAAGLVTQEVLVIVLGNVAVFVLAAGLIRRALVSLTRAPFWMGVALIALLILSRFLEYDTGLLAKSVVFLVLGAAVIWGGITFENSLRKKSRIHE